MYCFPFISHFLLLCIDGLHKIPVKYFKLFSYKMTTAQGIKILSPSTVYFVKQLKCECNGYQKAPTITAESQASLFITLFNNFLYTPAVLWCVCRIHNFSPLNSTTSDSIHYFPEITQAQENAESAANILSGIYQLGLSHFFFF